MKKIFNFFKTKLGIGAIGGAAFGGYFGKSIGMVGFFGGINAMWPFVLIGGLISFLFIKNFKFFKKNKEQSEIIKEQDEYIQEKDSTINKLQKDLEESEDMKKKIVGYYEGPDDTSKRSLLKIPFIGFLSNFFIKK